MHQQVFKSFGNFRKIKMSEPLDLFQLLLTAVQSDHDENTDSEIDSAQDEQNAKVGATTK
jgi:hypothetical protein